MCRASGAPCLDFCFLLAASTAFGQYGKGREGYVKKVPYIYNGQEFNMVTYGGQPAQVTVGMQVVLLISAGNVLPYPGADAHLVANAEDGYKAYLAGTPSGSAASAAPGAPAKAGLTVDGVVTMLNGGLSDDIIITKIHQANTAFDPSPDDMVRLKKAKASDAVIKAMMEATPAATAAAEAPAVAQAPTTPPASSNQAAAKQPTTPAAQPADPPKKKKGFFESIGESVKDEATGRSVIDKIGLQDALPQLDPNIFRTDQPRQGNSAIRHGGSFNQAAYEEDAQTGSQLRQSLSSKPYQLHDPAIDVLGLRQDDVFEDGLVGNEGVHGSDALDRRVEIVEQLVGDAGCNLGAVSPTEHVFMRYDHAAGLADGFLDGIPVIGAERAQVENLCLNALLAMGFVSGLERSRHQRAVGNERDIGAFAHLGCLAEGDHVIGAGIRGAAVGFAVETLVFEEEYGVVAADGGT
jgi:hypothetical protein